MAEVEEIRTAARADAAAVAALYRRSSLVWDDHRADLEANPELLIFDEAPIEAGLVRVAVAGGRIVGFSTVLPGEERSAELEDLFVEPDLLRGGVGRRLVADLATIAAAGGIRRIDVTANPNAVGFYERCGFVADGEVTTRFGPGLRMHLDL